jgi:UDP-N-acetylglucosamine--N-acetylmuramyl-(pentapeptide) pyrophosphoryl-undecaprenol N-acetylglucosamine transferase
MAEAYAVADLVLSRAGASSMTELAHAGLPSILVPYPYAADDHQTRNAEVFAAVGAAELVQERDLDEDRLAGLIDKILGDLPTRARMAQASRGLAVPDAAARVAGVIEESCG